MTDPTPDLDPGLVPADGEEPDRAAEYERAKRAGLQQGLVQFPDGRQR
jgi:hypothetical protein